VQPNIAHDLTKALKAVYVFEDHDAVAGFIRQHGLTGVLWRAIGPLNQTFGSVPIKILSVLCDDEGFETLFCSVVLNAALGEAQNALHRFDENWWVDNVQLVAGKLNFDFELR
jgi:hypothetical protein